MSPPPDAAPLVGVLVAAGRGRRFGGGKQLHPWPAPGGSVPLVAAAFDAIAGVCDAMIVVTAHAGDAVAAALNPRVFEHVAGNPDGEMIDSIRRGLLTARRRGVPVTVLLQPADHPAVAPATLTQMIAAYHATPALAIMPEYEGAGGHPVLIPPVVIEAVLAAGRIEGGLRRYWQDHPEQRRRLPVDDASVVRDVDTREDVG